MSDKERNIYPRLDLDCLDLEQQFTHFATRGLLYVSVPFILTRTDLLHGTLSKQELLFATVVSSIYPTLDLISLGFTGLKAALTHVLAKVGNKELGYAGSQLVYHGNDLEVGNGLTLQHGDNYIYLSMPRLSFRPGATLHRQVPPSERLDLQLGLWNSTARDVASRIEKRNVTGVCIEIPESMVQPTGVSNLTTLHHLGSEKEVPFSKPETKVLAIPKEDLSKIRFDQHGLRQKAVELLADKELVFLIHQLDNSNSLDQALITKQLILQRIRLIIDEYLEKTRDRRPLEQDKQPPFFYPFKRRQSTWARIQPDREGKLYLYEFQNGRDKKTAVDKCIDAEGKSARELIAGSQGGRNAQTAYGLYLLINDLDCAANQASSNLFEDSILQNIEARSLRVDRNRWSVYSLVNYLQGFKRNLKKIARAGLPLLFACGAILGARPGVYGLSQLSGYINSKVEASNQYAFDETPLETNFPSVIRSSLEWKVVASEGMSSDGYYITSTSREMLPDGLWAPTRRRLQPQPITLPTEIDPRLDRIDLFKRVPTDFFPYQTLKIPVKDHTKLAALQVVDQANRVISPRAYVLEDGTVELVKETGFISGTSWIDIRATLVPVDDPQVIATYRVAPLNLNKLNTKSREQLAAIRQYAGGRFLHQAVVDFLKETYHYSVSPKYRPILERARKPEDKVNAVSSIDNCSCSVCSTHALLLATLDDEPEAVLNLAFGFIKGASLSGAQSGYLKSEAAHAFIITRDGSILDSTPTKIHADKDTQEYLSLLRTEVSEEDWEKQLRAAGGKYELPNQISKLLLFLTAYSIGTSLFRRLLEDPISRLIFNTNNFLAKDFERSLRDEFFRYFSTSELKTFYQLFQHLSYGQGDFSPIPFNLSREALIRSILYDSNLERIRKAPAGKARLLADFVNSRSLVTSTLLLTQLMFGQK